MLFVARIIHTVVRETMGIVQVPKRLLHGFLIKLHCKPKGLRCQQTIGLLGFLKSLGEMAEWSNAPVSKTGSARMRGFDSHSLRELLSFLRKKKVDSQSKKKCRVMALPSLVFDQTFLKFGMAPSQKEKPGYRNDTPISVRPDENGLRAPTLSVNIPCWAVWRYRGAIPRLVVLFDWALLFLLNSL